GQFASRTAGRTASRGLRMKKIVLFAVVFACTLPFLAQAQVISHLGGGTSITVSTTRTLMKDVNFKGKGPRFVSVCNDETSENDIFVNGSGMTKDTGNQVKPGKCWYSGSLLAPTVNVYAVTEAGSATVRV